jgi:putative ABC transport system ATP-binding protein
MDIMQKLNMEQGLTVVLVTHEPDIARYSKRIVECRDGKVKRDVRVMDRLIASEVLPTLPEVGEEPDEEVPGATHGSEPQTT